jgi:predicted MFS family arabinose efflux permease
MTTSDTDTSKTTDHDRGASVRGWTAVAPVTLGTFTLVTNEFIPVGLLSNIAKDMHVPLGVASTTVTVPGLVAAAAAPLITVAVGQLDRRIVLALMSIAFIVADILAAFAPNIGVLRRTRRRRARRVRGAQ